MSRIITKSDRAYAMARKLGGTCRFDELAAALVAQGFERREVGPAIVLLTLDGRIEPLDEGEIVRVSA